MVFRAFCVGTLVREFQRKKCFSLEFHSLNRTSDLKVERYFRSEVQKEKGVFLLYFSHLFVPLTCRSKVLTFENPKRNLVFLFGFCSLNRTFVCEIY